MKNVKLRRIGTEVLVVIPEEWLAAADLGDGDDVELRLANGELIVSAPGERRERLMRLAREGMDEYHDALAELAK